VYVRLCMCVLEYIYIYIYIHMYMYICMYMGFLGEQAAYFWKYCRDNWGCCVASFKQVMCLCVSVCV
jgi:hypothetical protein